jgi:hypothetical protein
MRQKKIVKVLPEVFGSRLLVGGFVFRRTVK